MYDYTDQMNQQEKLILGIQSDLEKQKQLLSQTLSEQKQINELQNQTQNNHQTTQNEYQKLVNARCKPVTQCVPDIYKESVIPGQCQGILNQLEKSHNNITPELSEEIKKTLISSDQINQYDIRNHRDYYQLIENKKIQCCQKPTIKNNPIAKTNTNINGPKMTSSQL